MGTVFCAFAIVFGSTYGVSSVLLKHESRLHDTTSLTRISR